MAESTKIQWCSHTFNGWAGCTKVADGCLHCYAETLMDTRYGRVKWGPRGTRSRTKTWGDPPKWDRAAAKAGEQRKVFCCSLADVFEDFDGMVVDAKGRTLWRDRQGNYADAEASGFDPYEIATLDHLRSDLFRLIDSTPHLFWLLLTKRPENIRRMWPDRKARENVWLGTSIASMKDKDYVNQLLTCRGLAHVLFLSIEPQIGRVSLADWLLPTSLVDWVICGGESRQGSAEARPFHIPWAEQLRDECKRAAVPFFLKQFGSHVIDSFRNRVHFKDSHGGDWEEWPEDLRVRQCPETFYPQLVEA